MIVLIDLFKLIRNMFTIKLPLAFANH